jgi:uncharacterized membrane protein
MSSLLKAILGGLSGFLGFGISDFLIKIQVDKIGKYQSMIFVHGLWNGFLLPFLLVFPMRFEVGLQDILIILAFGFADVIAQALFYSAYEAGKASVISPIAASYAILAAIVSNVIFGEAFSTEKILAVVFVIVGVMLLSIDLKELKDGLQLRDLAKGVPQAICVLIIYGFFVPFWDSYITEDTWLIKAILTGLVTLVLMLIFIKFIKKEQIVNDKFDNKVWITLVALGVLNAVSSIGFDLGFVSSTETTITAVLSSASPLVLLMLSFVFLKERLAKNQYLGILVIIMGIIMMGLL